VRRTVSANTVSTKETGSSRARTTGRVHARTRGSGREERKVNGEWDGTGSVKKEGEGGGGDRSKAGRGAEGFTARRPGRPSTRIVGRRGGTARPESRKRKMGCSRGGGDRAAPCPQGNGSSPSHIASATRNAWIGRHSISITRKLSAIRRMWENYVAS